MTSVPDEIWTDILEYLDPNDLVTSQRVSQCLLKLARDSSLWRNKVFEKAPSAAHSQATSSNALSDISDALGGLSLGEPTSTPSSNNNATSNVGIRNRTSLRARAVLEWDKTRPDEKIDWYSEYVARHAPLSTTWAAQNTPRTEVRGMALYNNAEKVMGTLEDGGLAIWNIEDHQNGRRKLEQVSMSRSGLLFEDMYSLGESYVNGRGRSMGAAVDNISIDSKRKRAFVAVENTLNEIDLEKMEVISQNKFAWPITALSQEGDLDCHLTIGTSFSLHIHDPRLPFLKPSDNSQRLDSSADPNIAFLPNYSKEPPFPRESDTRHDTQYIMSDIQFAPKLEAYARIEPGPQTIIHRGQNEIVIAGRMPSILFYDRRNFPQPQTAIHSGGRLSGMIIIPGSPAEAKTGSTSDSTLIACGEYGGRGSLELYELPWDRKTSFSSARTASVAASADSAMSIPRMPFSFKNRQEASSSKLLSVAAQGTRIVFADSEGMLKWVERDGRGLARRWNINAFQIDQRGAYLNGDKVVRKMIALPEADSEQGIRGDGDLLIWTGEKIGIVTTKPKPSNDQDTLVKAFEQGMNLHDEDDQEAQKKEAAYSTIMRRALERQADERRWMSRFGGRRF